MALRFFVGLAASQGAAQQELDKAPTPAEHDEAENPTHDALALETECRADRIAHNLVKRRALDRLAAAPDDFG